MLDSGQQTDARVRRAVVSEVGGFFRDTAAEFTRKVLDTEKNPDIEAAAIRNLGMYGQPEVHDALLKFLNSESFHEELASAAIGAIRAQDDPAFIAPLLETLSKRETDFPSRSYAQGLGALAYLARNEEKKDAVREFLTGHLNDKKKPVQRAAIAGLGTLGDPKAIAVLTTFTMASKESPEHTAADAAVTTLRADRKPVDDFKNLRTEVMDLEKANRNLRKELDELKKKVDAQTATAPATPDKKKKAKPVSDKAS